MITIKDMAEIAGVSPTTVANVLHGRTKKMSKETLKKVQDVIDQSHYVSNMGARVLANYGSRIIGVIMNYDRRAENNAMADPFYGTIVGALEKEIREHGYYMMLYMAQGKLKFPMIAANDAYCKYLFDNRYGTGQSTWESL